MTKPDNNTKLVIHLQMDLEKKLGDRRRQHQEREGDEHQQIVSAQGYAGI